MNKLFQFKKSFFYSLALLFVGFAAFSAVVNYKADDIIGDWMVQDDTAIVRIWKRDKDNLYYGTVIWLKDSIENGSPKKDVLNPNSLLKERPIIGSVNMKEFKYDDAKKEYSGGHIYKPSAGKTYEGYMKLIDINTLYMKGFVMGVRWMGKDNTWKRVQK